MERRTIDRSASKLRATWWAVLLLELATAIEPRAADMQVANSADGTGVSIDGLSFQPSEVQVEAGTTVMWSNKGSVSHAVTSGKQGDQGAPGVTENQPPKFDGLFDQELPEQGSSFSFTFEKPVTY